LEPLISERYAHTAFVRPAWGLRHDLSYYDALYVALAARLGFPLLTADKRLATAPGLPCDVELIN
jgi:predicted nucleic acid-binding protein